VQTTRDPALEPTSLELGSTPELEAPPADPELVTDAIEMQQFVTKFGVEGPVEPVAVGLASEMPELYADHAAGVGPGIEDTQDLSLAAAEVSGRTGDTQDISESAAKVEAAPAPDAEFEARVAAAMNAFDTPLETAPEPLAAAPAVMDTQAIQEFAAAVAEIPSEPVAAEPEAVLELEAEPVAEMAPAPKAEELSPIEQEMARAFAQTTAETVEAAVPEVAAVMAAAVGGAPQAVAVGEAAMGALDDETLGHIVSTVVERLKPELIAEIRRKLAEKK
jgi:hypothetical protein